MTYRQQDEVAALRAEVERLAKLVEAKPVKRRGWGVWVPCERLVMTLAAVALVVACVYLWTLWAGWEIEPKDQSQHRVKPLAFLLLAVVSLGSLFVLWFKLFNEKWRGFFVRIPLVEDDE